ncbi:MAG TPA: radical SAM protein [Candidatus Acidoferrales bacterium]|jgi:coproporphyrinogen III oxidase-like Fe-S oxidoreductase|nr:radical SAM protein [Candidatus Acidoferrales bacterium]
MTLPSAQEELAARMLRPQRHRLLQGFPPLPLMQAALPSRPAAEPKRDGRLPFNLVRQADGAIVDERAGWLGTKKPGPGELAEPFINIDKLRPLIIGIIPHTQCIPRTPACGFCTFPHDAADKRQRTAVVRSVMHDIDGVVQSHGDKLRGRRVEAIYFGGGTANLSSTAEIRQLFDVLASHFRTENAEVSLEGIPSLFASWFHAHLKNLAALPVRHKRISMGIQTFDRGQIERMGRQAFGDEKVVKGIVRHAHDLGLTASGDFLFALPGQTLEQMRADVDRALECGFDQICLYHLVLYAGLGTPWSKDAGITGQMQVPGVIVDQWLDLRERLLANGFVQTTLTNFERKEIHQTDRRFLYEEASFNPDVYDALGFGPLSVSAHIDYGRLRGVKLMRRKKVRSAPWSGDDLYFGYEAEDLKLLWVTRCLAGLALNRTRYRSRFASDVAEDFPAALDAAVAGGLIQAEEKTIQLTPRGMFYSDAVIGTFAAERAAKLRERAAGLSTKLVLEEPISFGAQVYGGMG